MSEGMLSIGAFSRASSLSIKQLRAYDEADILRPAVIDPDSRYRYYHWTQLGDAEVIRRLRAVDLPLEQVRAIVRAGDPAVTAKLLEEHLGTMRERLAQAQKAIDDLQSALDTPETHTPVHVRRLEPMTVLAISARIVESEIAGFLLDTFGRIRTAIEADGVTPSGPAGALYPPEILDEDAAEEVTAYQPFDLPPVPSPVVGEGTGGLTRTRLPAVTAAVTTHIGGYDTIGDTYRLLGGWVARNAVPADGPIREIYRVTFDTTDDPARFLTDVCWPIDQ